MNTIQFISLSIIVITAIFFIILAGFSLLMPALAKRFLLGFATSLFKHFLELFLRFIIGTAFILAAQHLLFPAIFNLFGWVIIVTTVCLAFIPWHWHRRFAQYAVPKALQYIFLMGIFSLGLGVFILTCVFV